MIYDNEEQRELDMLTDRSDAINYALKIDKEITGEDNKDKIVTTEVLTYPINIVRV